MLRDLLGQLDRGFEIFFEQFLAKSRGPGTAIEFALELVELLFGRDRADEVAEPMLAQPSKTAALTCDIPG